MPNQKFTLSFTARKDGREVKAREDIMAPYLSLEGMDYLQKKMAERHRADAVDIEIIEQDFYGKKIRIWSKENGKTPDIQIANEFISGCHNFIEEFNQDPDLKKIWQDRLQSFLNGMKANNPGVYEMVKD